MLQYYIKISLSEDESAPAVPVSSVIFYSINLLFNKMLQYYIKISLSEDESAPAVPCSCNAL